jgi:hypothetical protein
MWKIIIDFFLHIDPGWNDFILIEEPGRCNPLPSPKKQDKSLQQCGAFLPGQHVTIERVLFLI